MQTSVQVQLSVQRWPRVPHAGTPGTHGCSCSAPGVHMAGSLGSQLETGTHWQPLHCHSCVPAPQVYAHERDSVAPGVHAEGRGSQADQLPQAHELVQVRAC